MSDKEMLELSAKAAGVKYAYASDEGCAIFDKSGNWTHFWNPLTDDGEALRLAAELKIDLEWQATRFGAMPEVEAYISDIDGESVCFSEDEHDYRLAIVAAAANLGRKMA